MLRNQSLVQIPSYLFESTKNKIFLYKFDIKVE